MMCGRNSYLDITERDCVLCEVRAKAEDHLGVEYRHNQLKTMSICSQELMAVNPRRTM